MTCTCFRPEDLLGSGDRNQARRIYEDAKSRCEDHGACLIIGCSRPLAPDDRFCAPHRYWVSYVLARPYYRDHEPPEVEADGSVQESLEALL